MVCNGTFFNVKNVLWLNEMSTLHYLIFFDLPLDVVIQIVIGVFTHELIPAQ